MQDEWGVPACRKESTSHDARLTASLGIKTRQISKRNLLSNSIGENEMNTSRTAGDVSVKLSSAKTQEFAGQ